MRAKTNKVLNYEEACNYLEIGSTTLSRWVKLGLASKVHGRARFFRIEDLKRWKTYKNKRKEVLTDGKQG